MGPVSLQREEELAVEEEAAAELAVNSRLQQMSPWRSCRRTRKRQPRSELCQPAPVVIVKVLPTTETFATFGALVVTRNNSLGFATVLIRIRFDGSTAAPVV